MHIVRCDAAHMVRCWCTERISLFFWKAYLSIRAPLTEIDSVIHRLRPALTSPERISRITNRSIWSDAMHVVRCDVMHVVRCGSCLYKTNQSENKPMLIVRCDVMHVVR